MPAVELRAAAPYPATNDPTPNPLPSLLHTPSGLAIVEIQGTIHGSFQDLATEDVTQSPAVHPIGRLEFPLHKPQEADEGKWMKKVYLYVGRHQRLTGEVKKLAKPLAVLRKVDENELGSESESGEALEIVDVVKFKLMFGARPEPVGE
ncbi:uncharacterized protein Z520_08035 [Fonsecaea multimorphosa CBS 102226]|uniref:Chromosome transmission fidelity protein 8 n=1 Tax=Fonsecaea multimorphosa CBS 102226 TaxID=1442371 RepID=A0A0D2JS23_9EURO|nr:uncharacterized protein Z520_08035 [Fonsecaea multimorphosa CBS 102226]KIX96257.1 hypothetical protein Z520_08035 [Fonsecaea multimorphosa CBS 102226]OAL21920.1 hypothetical protein AYO22_07517 [Fonsecaea multimorphosa]